MADVSRSETCERTRVTGTFALLRGMIRRRRGLTGVAVAVLAVTVWEFTLSVPQNRLAWALAVLHVVSVACTPFVPLPASGAVLAIGVVTSIVPYQGGPSQLWGAMLALGVIGMMCRPVVAAASCAVVIVTQAVQTFVLHSPVVDESGFPFFVLCFASAAALGHAVRLHREIAADRERRLRAEMLLRRMQVALQLHDEVANDLVVAAQFAQRRMRHAGDEEERKAWDEENQRILSALSDVHAIIDATAIAEREEVDESSGAAFEHLLRDVLAQERQRLGRAGLNVDMRLSGRIRRSIAPAVRHESSPCCTSCVGMPCDTVLLAQRSVFPCTVVRIPLKSQNYANGRTAVCPMRRRPMSGPLGSPEDGDLKRIVAWSAFSAGS